ncbi:uncharacterized protein BCR38DRAFT_375017 [Pseudomassariella vexata]|uniref:DUF7918 domain-containing protein n=1 Tax=Pseudomassariella vexata TaxID=1141098 RepID=A0A1Y2DLC7_9PEZI|nr:uncharacterized protein BCR38DRAFT_375017 [Pseudomassariella vexata]ORY60031.1 hypothetical protein BCR38DRAFT_375017 [Pseudomassariella vexata]
MTIIEDVPGVEIAVQIGGADVVEYDALDADGDEPVCPTITKYIECIDDAHFVIRTRIDNFYHWGYKDHVLSLQLYIDGTWINARICRASDTRRTGYRENKISGREEPSGPNGQWVLRKFKFSSVHTVDDSKRERVEKDREIAKNLGVIEVKVRRGTDYGLIELRQNTIKNKKFEIAEKALKGKAISHGTALTAGDVVAAPNYVDFRYLPEDGDRPIAVYKFLYRSREALKREIIIPRTPPPRSPTLAALSEAERDRLARERLEELRHARIKSENGAIKREFGEVYDLTMDNVPKRPKLGPGEVIDLTDD